MPPGELSDLAATALFMAGKHQELQHLAKTLSEEISPATRDLIAWSYIEQGNTLSDQAKTKSGPEADALFSAAGEKYAAALEVKPDKHEALNNWGSILHDEAKRKEKNDSSRILKTAHDKYKRALELAPDNHWLILYNMGSALAYEAKIMESDELFTKAYDRFEMAVQEKPNFSDAFFEWGTALFNQALLHFGDWDKIKPLLADSIKYLQEVLTIDPTKHEALINKGLVLNYAVMGTKGGDAQALLYDSVMAFSQALEIAPNNYAALFNLGNALYCLGGTKTGVEQQRLEQEAEDKFLAAEDINKGIASHVLASFAARRGDAEACRNWLQRARDYGGFPNLRYLLESSDFCRVRDEAWFREFLDAI